MLYYVSKGIDVNKTSESKECNICLYWYILDKGFKFKPVACSGCHDLLTMSMNSDNSDSVGLNINGAAYCCIFSRISKSEAINSRQKFDLTGKSRTLQNRKIYYHIQKWIKKF